MDCWLLLSFLQAERRTRVIIRNENSVVFIFLFFRILVYLYPDLPFCDSFPENYKILARIKSSLSLNFANRELTSLPACL